MPYRLFVCLLLFLWIIPFRLPVQAEENGQEGIDWAGTATYQIIADAPDAAFHQTEYKNYPGPIDGLSSKSETWTGFFRQGGRTIWIDLGEQRTIQRISLEFNQNLKSGIMLPPYVDIGLSNDRNIWNQLGRIHHAVSPSDAQVQTRTLGLTFQPVQTRYIQIQFPVDVWVFARHLSITGPVQQDASLPAVLPFASQTEGQSQPFLQIPGVNDILLVYTGAHEEKGTWTEQDFIPMITYVNQGTYQGTMFDTMLFLPFPEVGSTKADWEAYLEDLFQQGVQLSALNEAVGKVNRSLSEQRKEKVILTLPYPDPEQANFGSLDGKETLSFSAGQAGSSLQALQNRLRAVHWYYERLMEKWEQARLANLELVGIYWYEETIDPAVPEETALVKNVAYTVHEKGHKFYWIPYFGAKGYERWEELGFDYVLLQPNFYANQDPPEERMINVADTAQRYRLGVEIELDQKVLSSQYYYDLFYKQLEKGHQLGLDQAVTNAYYAGAKTTVYAAQSTLPQARKIYDDLYSWIQGTYGEGP